MILQWSKIQKQRLIELNASIEVEEMTFSSEEERNKNFQRVEKQLVADSRASLALLQKETMRPALLQLETRLVNALTSAGFVQVTTPHIITRDMLNRMSISDDHPLSKQVFWLENNKCLRPMLAPNLYTLLRSLERVWEKPVRIFEIGTCFRKESQGQNHLNEFTMLNLVELGDFPSGRVERLHELAKIIMHAAEIDGYTIEQFSSEVYKETLDVMVNGLEVGSGAYGPHELDHAWGVFSPWVGIGFGLERLTAIANNYQNIRRTGRSLTYLNGARLNL